MKRREMLVGAVMSAVGGALLLCLPLLIERKTGSRAATTAFSSFLFPAGTLALWLTCGLGLMAQAWFTADAERPKPMAKDEKVAVLRAMAVSLGYALLMPRLGFLAATIPCMTLAFMIFGLSSWLRGLAYSLATTLFIYVVFVVFLRVPVPAGLFI